MCGICGIVHSEGLTPDGTKLEKMSKALTHRGPDSEGIFTDRAVGLAVRRLAVIDLTTGDQPITNEDKSLVVVMNGEIYNYLELRAHLKKKGHVFRTNSDTETLVHLYEEYGDGLVDWLRGMFAFAIWDANEQRLLIGRDRFGKKPLFYTVQNGKLYFSSEIHSLVQGISAVPEIDLKAVDLF